MSDQPEMLFNLNGFTADEVNTIGRALGKLPYEEVVPIVVKLKRMVLENEQRHLDLIKAREDGAKKAASN